MNRNMNAKRLWLGSLLGMLLVAAGLRGQESRSERMADAYGTPGSAPVAGTMNGPEGTGPLGHDGIDHPDAALSSWILHPAGGDCCGPVDGRPIASELYVRAGPSFNIGGRNLNGALDTGFDSSAGFRVSFLNREGDRAWVIDLGISDIYNTTHSPGRYTLI